MLDKTFFLIDARPHLMLRKEHQSDSPIPTRRSPPSGAPPHCRCDTHFRKPITYENTSNILRPRNRRLDTIRMVSLRQLRLISLISSAGSHR